MRRGSLPELILRPIALVEGNPLNEALFSADSGAFVTSIEIGSEQFTDVVCSRVGPLMERWQRDGQLQADVDIREALHWMNTVALYLLMPPWRERAVADQRVFLDRYLVRALVSPPRPRRRR